MPTHPETITVARAARIAALADAIDSYLWGAPGPCSHCAGSGQWGTTDHRCPSCGGSGGDLSDRAAAVLAAACGALDDMRTIAEVAA